MSTTLTPDLEQLQYPVGRLHHESNPGVERMAGWIQVLTELPGQMRAATAGLTPAQLDTEYRPAGWTVRQVVHHVPDSHMNAYLRTHWILSEEKPTIKPYDQAVWAEFPYSRTAPIETSLDLLEALHARWVVVLHSLNAEQWRRRYHHPEEKRDFILSDLLQTYAWHSRHHLAHITSLRQRNGW